MKYCRVYVLLCCLSSVVLDAQTIPDETLDSIFIASNRIDLPFSKNSKTLQIISSEVIASSPANNLADLLQFFGGVDIRRRGLGGSQADVYIRGGGFDQVLLLIDGMKVEDPQTGHHTLNMALPIEVIERIEIVKGPAARIFGQNAFTGAINIVTKKVSNNSISSSIEGGSYGQKNLSFTTQSTLNNSSHLLHVSNNLSDGYRYNTDFDNRNYFLKSTIETKNAPIQLIGSFMERQFGANGFYASPYYKDQYEETQASVFGIQSNFDSGNWKFKPRVYWKRNQDLYLFVRNNPSLYRNLHISNKVAVEFNSSNHNSLGTTGMGIELARVNLSSNNLGRHNRTQVNAFVEHRFSLLGDHVDFTPGIALNYFSDFKFHAFPGVDVGYAISEKSRIYGNVGLTYRIPTYTDLYYNSPTTIGNSNLSPESALAFELGYRFNSASFDFAMVGFRRNSDDLIDYVKELDSDPWQAQNLIGLETTGLELSSRFSWGGNILRGDYTYISDNVKAIPQISQYAINSLQQQLVMTWESKLIDRWSQQISFRYCERGDSQAYSVLDARIIGKIGDVNASITANNILNEDYTETNLVPAPKGSIIFGLNYFID
jgi:vitamin B12 transporter